MPRLLTTSASAVKRLRHKADLMAVDVEGEEIKEAQVTALAEVPRKWHLPPAFSVEFVAYVVDRERRISHLREQVLLTEACYPLLYLYLTMILIDVGWYYEKRSTRSRRQRDQTALTVQ